MFMLLNLFGLYLFSKPVNLLYLKNENIFHNINILKKLFSYGAA